MRLSCDARNPAKPGHVFFLSALSLLTGAVTALLPAETVAARVIFAAAGLALFLLLESYALRFTAVSFRYEIREESFLVLRVIRKREKPLFRRRTAGHKKGSGSPGECSDARRASRLRARAKE